MTYLLYYLLIINFCSFGFMGADKFFAVKHLYRIPEKTLLFFTFIGGSLGAYIAMFLFHHKTLHKKFRYGIPAALAVHIAIIFFLAIKFAL